MSRLLLREDDNDEGCAIQQEEQDISLERFVLNSLLYRTPVEIARNEQACRHF